MRILSTAALAFLAVIVGVRAWNQLGQPPSIAGGEPQAREFLTDWERATRIARHVTGGNRAPVAIVALMDLECPACRRFHETAAGFVRERPRDARLLYVHYPLSYHGAALDAARAAECAYEIGPGAFAAWIDVIYDGQDLLGRRAWLKYAEEAGINDAERIAQCARSEVDHELITAGLAFGQEIGIQGTPTVIVNGWRYRNPPSRSELQSLTDSILAGTLMPPEPGE